MQRATLHKRPCPCPCHCPCSHALHSKKMWGIGILVWGSALALRESHVKLNQWNQFRELKLEGNGGSGEFAKRECGTIDFIIKMRAQRSDFLPKRRASTWARNEDYDDDVGGMLSAVRRKPRPSHTSCCIQLCGSSSNFIHIPLAVRKLCEAKEGQRQEKPWGSKCAKAKRKNCRK